MTDVLPLPSGVDIDVGSSVDETPRVLKAQFGDGYAQRAADGMNSVPLVYSVTFTNLTRDEANTIIDFFRAKKGAEAFNWTIPGEDDPRLWTADKWTRTHVDVLIDTVNATFTEVFIA